MSGLGPGALGLLRWVGPAWGPAPSSSAHASLHPWDKDKKNSSAPIGMALGETRAILHDGHRQLVKAMTLGPR